ncbi:MAG: dihydrolipoyl dehydrogenase [Candidatus Dormibacteria bacterium]
MAERFDVAVLGGGMGGYVAAIRAAQLGLRVSVIEMDKLGGTCLHRGCIPTKALLQSAFLLDQLRHGERLGVIAREVEYDYSRAVQNRDEVVATLHKGVQGLMGKNRVTVIRGRGRLEGPSSGGNWTPKTQSVVVTSDAGEMTEVEADNVIVATGSRPKQLPGAEADGQSVLTSDDVLRMDRLPASAIVLGAGAVGVEFASYWRSTGVDVTVVEMLDRLVPLEDAAVGDELRKQFEARGIRCLTGAGVELDTLERGDGSVAVTVVSGEQEERIQAEVLLMSVGRAPNSEDLGLEGLGVRLDRGFVVIDDLQRTGVDGVYAIGDLVGGFQLAHKGSHEGIIAAEVIAGEHPHPLESRHVPRTTYCTPQIGSIGLSESQAREAGHDIRTATFPFRGNGRALIWGETGGFCKIVSNQQNDILGIHLIGPEVTELVYAGGLGALLEATPYEMGRAMAPHPTLSEVLMEAGLAATSGAIHF